MAVITISRDVSTSGLGRIRARDEKHGTLAMALEVRDYTQWQLAVITSPRDLPEPVTYPRVEDEHDAVTWLRYLAELVTRAERAEAVTR
ncbi:hypothetical protein SEA_PHILONIUS_42 [Mycobacterium phage Philonius]|uniref:Uncharacterized protein n=1 Tax=Mycobacterium phage Philonius TaxID=2047843 RepID=A0A2H4PD08_9CAUD|nr:hypothetical protein KD928_gp42 [Mycobacterium phage Philonius]ATW60101.1 hypothetical protein SEA_PHILONIUS_42 [Mycobacterium phage Philonius]